MTRGDRWVLYSFVYNDKNKNIIKKLIVIIQIN